jgi:hypothetical protein
VTGSDALWSMAETLGVVPSPPDPVLAATLSAWWAEPRQFGCLSASSSPLWVLVMPSPLVLCARCAGEAYAVERRCAYCHRPVRLRRALTLAYEMRGVHVMGRCHRHCAEQARRRDG